MRARLALSVLLLTAAFGRAEAQWLKETYVSVFAAERDTNYIQDLSRMFSVNASVFQKNSAFSIDDLKNLSSLQYACSDSSASVSVGFAYKWLSLNLGVSTGLLDRHRSGRKTILSTQVLLPAVTLKFGANFYEGYYLSNAESILQDWPVGTRFERPDISTASLRVSADYYFNVLAAQKLRVYRYEAPLCMYRWSVNESQRLETLLAFMRTCQPLKEWIGTRMHLPGCWKKAFVRQFNAFIRDKIKENYGAEFPSVDFSGLELPRDGREAAADSRITHTLGRLISATHFFDRRLCRRY